MGRSVVAELGIRWLKGGDVGAHWGNVEARRREFGGFLG